MQQPVTNDAEDQSKNQRDSAPYRAKYHEVSNFPINLWKSTPATDSAALLPSPKHIGQHPSITRLPSPAIGFSRQNKFVTQCWAVFIVFFHKFFKVAEPWANGPAMLVSSVQAIGAVTRRPTSGDRTSHPSVGLMQILRLPSMREFLFRDGRSSGHHA